MKNGHNPHDAVAARIVAGAIAADKLPPAAAKAVRRALGAAGMKPPAALSDVPIPGRSDEDVRRAAEWERLNRLAGERINRHQEAVVLALAQDQTPRGEFFPTDIGDLGERLKGFDYPPSETAPGYREYEIDGTPLIRFYAPEVAFDGDSMLVNLRYRVAT
jgi:hypothetical protein